MESHPHHPKTIVRNGVITLEHYLALTDSHKTEDLTINHLNQLLDRNTCLLTDSHKTEDLTINHLNQICLSGCLVRRKMKYARSNSFPRSFQNLLPYRSRVLRDGKWSEQDAAILVSGDIISIKLGDIVRVKHMSNTDLGNSNLFGHLVPELGKLENLQYLELYKNNIQGTIPAELGNLKSLISLDLYSNNITGTMTILMVQYKAD